MRGKTLIGIAIVSMLVLLMVAATSCFGSNGGSSTATPEVLKPKPSVQKTVANFSGTKDGYYVTLDIIVKNSGSEGVILVTAAVTQAGRTQQDEMEVFLKQGASHELKMTFPLVWKGGEPTYNVQAIIP